MCSQAFSPWEKDLLLEDVAVEGCSIEYLPQERSHLQNILVFELSENHVGEIIDLVHERGRDVPLAKVRFNNGSISFIPAVIGAKVGFTDSVWIKI